MALALMTALLTVLSVSPVAAETADLTATLTGEQEVPPADTAATGSASVTIDTEAAAGAQLCYEVASAGLEGGAAVAAHIHEGAAGDAPANNIVVTLTVDADGNGGACAADADFNLANSGDPDIATLLADIIANPGEYYVNVHTETFPAGEIRGQLAIAGGGEPATGMLMIMKHYCNADDSNPDTTVDVRSEEEFMEVEAGGMGDPVVAVALTVLACPVERLPGDEPVSDTIAHFEEEFDFLVTDSTGAEFTLADATFTNLHACEADDGRSPLVLGEVDGDAGTNVCVDFSFYGIDGVAEGEVTVTETFHEGEHEFGTVRFTPAEVDPDDDSRTLLGFNRETSTVNIDTSLDDDEMAMLHIYNFDTAAAAAPAPIPTPAASVLPDAATNSAASIDVLLLLVGLSGLTLAISAAFVMRQRATRLS
jgi:hypothetical protein